MVVGLIWVSTLDGQAWRASWIVLEHFEAVDWITRSHFHK